MLGNVVLKQQTCSEEQQHTGHRSQVKGHRSQVTHQNPLHQLDDTHTHSIVWSWLQLFSSVRPLRASCWALEFY